MDGKIISQFLNLCVIIKEKTDKDLSEFKTKGGNHEGLECN
jgi:hypothetical protein